METQGLTRSLIDDLRTLIIIGEFKPGSRINEIRLAGELNISRSPLREALRTLENERLIVSIPRKGSFVTDMSAEGLKELFQVREMIECYAIRLLGENGITDLPRVFSCAEKSVHLQVPTSDDHPRAKLAYISAMADFHFELVRSAANRQLFDMFQTIHANNNRYVFRNAFLEGTTQHRSEDHCRILEEIAAGNYKAARQVMKAHIQFNLNELLKKMEKRELAVENIPEFDRHTSDLADILRTLQTG